jgi:transcription initiation factor IIF auxiliary subunit
MISPMLTLNRQREIKLENWLALNEYANKYQVSISTLRRRIKSSKIKYKLDDGKYFIEDTTGGAGLPTESTLINQVAATVSSSENISTTKLLLEELKRAYLDSLQSKEDQILYLKQQVSDLKTLTMFLEKENNRLNGG